MDVPPYLSPGEIAKAAGVSRKRALGDLRRAKLIERHTTDKGVVLRVAEGRLRESLTEYYERVWAHYDRLPQPDPTRPNQTQPGPQTRLPGI